MKNLKVLIKLNFKVRRRTVLVSEHNLNNKFTLCNAKAKLIRAKVYTFARKYACETIPAGFSFLFKQKVQANKSCLHIYTLCAIKARTRTIKEWTKQNFCIKNQNSFKVKSLQKLNASTASPNKYTIRFLFIFLNVLPPIPTFLRDLPNVNQEKELNQMGAWFNEVCGDEKISLPMSAQNFARMAETSVPLMCSQTDFCKRRLGLNNILNDRVLTLRSFNKFFQKREKHKMIRPLLDFKRETITMVCKDFKMPVYPDQSNKSVQYSRNRIRKQIIPSIKYFINPQVESSLFKLAELLNKEQSFLYSVLRNTSANVPL